MGDEGGGILTSRPGDLASAREVRTVMGWDTGWRIWWWEERADVAMMNQSFPDLGGHGPVDRHVGI